ncbi:hypothetical protein CRG98_030393 [Punica granatum]|uniref:Uncharacterized protein n=1 Tax=Punica granatum TaxID=22663 RepID=A0A2I0IYZ7_PUNGR|nr:hypothetical protein CRG98_030393 [Punica granatum]
MEWDHECQKAFDTIKAYLIQPSILVPPAPNRPLILYLTVRRQSLGCMLGQEDESTRTERAIYYLKFPIDDNTLINTDFPDEGILQVDKEKEEPTWKMYFDGAVNSVGSGVEVVLISPDMRHYPVAAKVDFSCTNNVAEYEACILGLQAAIDFKVKELEVFGDSMLTIFQTLGQWKTKDAKLVPYHEYLEELAKSFKKISFTYTPRAKNQFADALATLTSMAGISEGNTIEPLEIKVAQGPAHCNAIEASEAKPWYEDIKNFLQTSQYPPFADRRCTDPNVDSRRGPHCALLDRAAWSERPPSRGDARRTRVREGVATYHFTTRRSRADKLPESRGMEHLVCR